MRSAEARAMPDLYFEDFKVGDCFVSAGITVSESMILEFALRYDPQPFHLNVEAAKESHYGGLIASGFQTMALGFRAFLDLGVFRACGMGSPGLDELRWPRPVRPGDTIHSELTIAEIRPSRSKPDRGLLMTAVRILNQRGEAVMTFKGMQLTRKRG
jgi:acyl dehydratase